MGYRTQAYAVDIDRIRSTFGSNDDELLRAIEQEFADEFPRNDEWFSREIRRGAPTLREALAQIVQGKITAREGIETEFQYGYAAELLCRHLGRELDNDDLIKFVDDLEIPTGITTSGPPLPIPESGDFPAIGFLTADQVRQEFASLKDEDLSHDDDDIAAA